MRLADEQHVAAQILVKIRDAEDEFEHTFAAGRHFSRLRTGKIGGGEVGFLNQAGELVGFDWHALFAILKRLSEMMHGLLEIMVEAKADVRKRGHHRRPASFYLAFHSRVCEQGLSPASHPTLIVQSQSHR